MNRMQCLCWKSHIRFLLFIGMALVLAPAAPAWGQDQDFLTAEKLYRAKQFSQAEQFYARVDLHSLNYPVAQLRLGTIYYLTERPEQAEKCLAIYLKFKETPEAYCLLAGALFNERTFDRATSAAQHALQLDPKSSRAYTVLGMIHTEEKDFVHAEADYREALKFNDHDSDTWFMLGRSMFLRDDFAEAAEAFKRALALNPQSVRSYENLARTKDVLGDLKGAEETYQEGLRASRMQSHSDPHIYVQYGEFLLALNRLADSENIVKEASRAAPQNAELHYELGKVYFHMDRLPDAAQEGETAIRLGGSDYKVDFLLAQIYTAMGKAQEAAEHAARAARTSPSANR